ncbi:MAG: DUF4149 domain-containing protein [Pseudomonadota bacterium]
MDLLTQSAQTGFLVGAAIWTGAIVFQAGIVAPTAFTTLDAASAQQFIRRLFPRLFVMSLVIGAAMLALVLTGAAFPEHRFALTTTLAVMLALQALSLVLVPAINAARDSGPAGAARFKALHGASVLATIAVMFLGWALLFVIAGH